MADEAMGFLKPGEGSVILDATVGCAGHAERILEKISPDGFLIGVDADAESLALAAERLKKFATSSYSLLHGNFRDIDALLRKLGIKKIDAALFDLGISSYQLEKAGRGFSFAREGLLDMRMDRSKSVRAYDLVNRCRREDLEGIIRKFGEERYSRKIAGAIIERRKARPVETTGELAEIVGRAAGRKYRSQKIHPATRTFQALRIAVNEELESLEEGLQKTWGFLACGGRIVAISFHSLEDRIVKRFLKGLANNKNARVLTKKPAVPSPEEKRRNPRSRSAKMRAAEKI